MTSIRTLFAVLAAIVLTAPASAANTHVKVCDLRGGASVPPTTSDARGCGRFVIDTNTNTISWYIAFSALDGDETAAHIHGNAGPGSTAGIKINLGTGNPKVGSATYDEADEGALLTGQWYVNIHSTAFPGGEIRGQIADMVADCNGFQENPSIATSGSAWGVFEVDTCANRVFYYIFVESLMGSETAAHIHGFSLHGANSGVQHTLPLGQQKKGVWNYPAADEGMVLDGLTYVNVHSTAFPAGELRGQNVFAPPPCVGDINCDGEVNVGDLLALLADWGPCAGCAGDLNLDGVVNVSDMLLLLAGWGKCP